MTDVATVPTVLSAEDVHMMMRQIRDARSRMAEEVATCDADRAKLQHDLFLVDEHQERVTKEDRERIAFLEGQLEAHLLNLRATDDRIKSVKTPWGDITSRALPLDYQRDDAVLKAWMLENGWTTTRTVTDINWEGLKKACQVKNGRLVTPDGETVPGVDVVDRPPKVTVEVVP